MFSNMALWEKLILASLVSFLISYFMTPYVKRFAELVGAMDQPSARGINKVPIPRMGGLAIFLGFVLTALLFAPLNTQVTGIMLGAAIIAMMGEVDDIISLNPWVKLAGQIVAAVVVIRCGVVFDAISNPNPLSEVAFIEIGWLSVPLTVLWIVACTNAVNLIDGLDGLAVGVSAISSLTMLVVSLIVSDPAVSLLLAALTGACLGFMPYNLNPAKIFMGDVGSQLLGFVLSTVSILGLFKMHAIITFVVPFLALALPLTDTTFAFFRRILRGQSPFHPDRGHLHHRLLDMGLSQKQAVALMYGISALLGIAAVLMTWTNPVLRIGCAVLAFGISITVWLFVFRKNPNLHVNHHESDEKKEQK
jgi:UDP-GlcNAc:undecaprenyl-phosphate GlcNAc-1-phosphate transferase